MCGGWEVEAGRVTWEKETTLGKKINDAWTGYVDYSDDIDMKTAVFHL
jgi:hypothetical protein